MASSRLERIGTIFTRKQECGNVLQGLNDITSQMEAECAVLRDNEQKLERFAEIMIKCVQQTTAAHNQQLKALKEVIAAYKKDVEGLLTRGAMKPDDRPIWFDVYKAFPPIAEPKFARPKPEIAPIRPILYQEDVVRAKLHSQGHGLGAVNMLNPAGDTHTNRLVQQYDKLKAEGVPEAELIEKTVASVDSDRSERQIETPKFKPIAKNPESVTTKVLDEAGLKNIFKEQ